MRKDKRYQELDIHSDEGQGIPRVGHTVRKDKRYQELDTHSDEGQGIARVGHAL